MYSPQKTFADRYHRVQVETTVDNADPHKLVELLLIAAIDAISKARGCLERKDVAGKGQQVGRAVRILEEGLRSSLDKSAGGKVAQDLDQLYQYVIRRLTLANLRNDAAGLGECVNLLMPVKEAWTAIRPAAATARKV